MSASFPRRLTAETVAEIHIATSGQHGGFDVSFEFLNADDFETYTVEARTLFEVSEIVREVGER